MVTLRKWCLSPTWSRGTNVVGEGSGRDSAKRAGSCKPEMSSKEQKIRVGMAEELAIGPSEALLVPTETLTFRQSQSRVIKYKGVFSL